MSRVTASIELHRIAGEYRRIPDAGLYAAGKLVKKLAGEEAARVTGGDGRLTGKKRRGIKLTARDDGIAPEGQGRRLVVRGSPAGPWQWVTTGTKAHDIRRRKRGPMRKMTVRHPGTGYAGAYDRVNDRAVQLVPRVFEDLVAEAVR